MCYGRTKARRHVTLFVTSHSLFMRERRLRERGTNIQHSLVSWLSWNRESLFDGEAAEATNHAPLCPPLLVLSIRLLWPACVRTLGVSVRPLSWRERRWGGIARQTAGTRGLPDTCS